MRQSHIFLFLSFLILIVFENQLSAQSAHYAPNSRAVQNLQILDLQDTSRTNFHAGLRNYYRKDVGTFLNESDTILDDRSSYLIQDNAFLFKEHSLNEKGKAYLKGLLFKTPSNLFQLETKFLELYINPIVNISFGNEKQRNGIRFQNMRGLELYGTVDEKVYFYSNILETQGNFHNYIEDRIRRYSAIPGYSFYKPFISGVSPNIIGRDYANAKGYLGVPISKHIAIELGHGNHFIGHGYHSLLLEDYSNNYFYLKLNTRVWKLHYQNLFAELAPISTRLNPEDRLLPKKYMAAHYLSYKPFKNFEIGLYESIIFARPDKFEFHYLNPVILYRTVEYYLDSPDNVIIGLNAKWNLFNKISVYGQFILDDIKFGELNSGTGWWGNKFGGQLGLFYPDLAGVDNLNLRAEYNVVRPYTYSHRDTLAGFEKYSIANYSNYNQPLAHPLGANFREALVILDYKALNSIFIRLKMSYAQQGRSGAIQNPGYEILLPDESRPGDFGIEFLQGELTDISSIQLDISYSFYHNYYLDFTYLKRSEQDSRATLDTDYIGVGIRANIQPQSLDY